MVLFLKTYTVYINALMIRIKLIINNIFVIINIININLVFQANLSRSEYANKMEIYEKIVEQTRSIKRIQEEFKHLKFRTRSEHQLKLSDFTVLEDDRARLKFDLSEFDKLRFGSTLITSAKLNIKLRRREEDRFSLRTKKAKVIQIMTEENPAEGTVVDTQDVINDEQDEVVLSFDVTDTVQTWLLEEESNQGLLVEAAGWVLVEPAALDSSPALIVQSEFSLTRHRRSAFFPGFSRPEEDADNSGDCSAEGEHSNKCCRDDMIVKFRDLQGFNFILKPAEFNAFMCRGKCPARFRPLNDHSLLQSLLHMRQQRQEGGGGGRVKRPCCVPAKLSSLPILHLDEEDPAKLKVTVWKSIVVTECACG